MRYSGRVGYVHDAVETIPGIWEPAIIVKRMRGNVESLTSRSDNNDKVNSDLSTTHRISVVGDKYSFANFMYIRFAEHMGQFWEVNSVQVMGRPRMILNIGGLYNGPTDPTQ